MDEEKEQTEPKEQFGPELDAESCTRAATVDEVVREARRHTIFAVRVLRAVASGRGGRGSTAMVTAANSLLMTARVNGASAEELQVMDELQKTQDRGLRLVSVEDARAEMMRRRAVAAANTP